MFRSILNSIIRSDSFGEVQKKVDEWNPLIVEIDEKVMEPLKAKTHDFGSFLGARERNVFVGRMEDILSKNPSDKILRKICESLREENGRWADGIEAILIVLNERAIRTH